MILTLSSTEAMAVACVDAAGNSLQIMEISKDAARWIEEKALWAAEEAGAIARAQLEEFQAQYREAASISKITESVSETANAASEERYATSPTVCEAINTAKAWADTLTEGCGAYVKAAEKITNKISDCNGTGLNCETNEERREEIAGQIGQMFEHEDGDKLALVLDGARLFMRNDQTGYTLDPATKEETDMALDLVIGLEQNDLPRAPDGSFYDTSVPENAEKVTLWARKQLLSSIADKTLLDINSMYQPTDSGRAGLMQQLDERVNYFNSEEYLKLLSNTNDKDNLPLNWDQMSPSQKHRWNQNAPKDSKLVSSEQAIRMLGEQMAVQLRLSKLNLEINQKTATMQSLHYKMVL